MREDLNFCRRQFPADAAQGLFVAASEDKIASLGRECLRDGEADAARGAGNQGDLRPKATS